MSDIQTSIIENLAFPIAVVTRKGELLHSNHSFNRTFGDQAKEWLERGSKEIAGEKGWLQSLFGKEIDEAEVEVEHDSRTYRVTVIVKDGDDTIATAFEDVTRQREIEQARSDFTSMIVHDLRGPLSGIQGTLEFILDNAGTSIEDLHKELLEESMRESKRMMSLIDEILDFSKIESGNFEIEHEPMQVGAVLKHSVRSLVQASQRDGVHLLSSPSAELPTIEGSPDKLTQVLINLLSNSLKFTAKGGVIAVRGRLTTNSAGESQILITVTDTGIGIKPEDQGRLFRKYKQAEGKSFRGGSGTGLGLYIVKEVVEAHGGTVSLASIEGAGTSMVLTIPVHAKDQKSA